ncbi:MAG: Dyp-type peroxidase [Cytophagaceae bacterium]|jgi:Dyp-type peroxidase family|nr:Dyp-type peroxidase [Cytophagaceae bacterium]
MQIKHHIPPTIEMNDIQGIVVRGYGYMPSAYYLMLSITNVNACKSWLVQVADQLTHGLEKPDEGCLNLAFSNYGLKILGLPEEAQNTFVREFREGMAKDYRQRMLGDIDQSAPANWDYGYPEQSGKDTQASENAIHLCLMVFAADDAALDQRYQQIRASYDTHGLREVAKLEGKTLPGRKEHFGFRDGISQPMIEGIGKQSSEGNTCKTGEFILGYLNEYEQYPDTPLVSPQHDQKNLLPISPLDPSKKDFGKNGTFMVFRTLEQDVKNFWDFVNEEGKKIYSDKEDPAVFLASKMVGRWPSGAPITKCPFHDNPALSDDDNFYYSKDDPDGMKCPIGSHLRRSNARDTFIKDDVKESIRVTKRNRIIRRGRPYGNPLVPDLNPQEVIQGKNDEQKRGLQFICFNSSIARQFELVQQSWVNDPKFLGLYDDSDPLIGHDPRGFQTNNFTIPDTPVRRRVMNIPRFVRTKGGAYFFMPGIKAIKYLASI